VSKVVPGVHDRVLTVTGDVEGIVKVYNILIYSFRFYNPSMQAYSLIISQVIAAGSSTVTSGAPTGGSHTSLRLLISHYLMGAIIGRSGLKIKSIQDNSGARMVASKKMLPQSTERIVEVQGTTKSIGTAIEEIGKCLLEDWERGLGTVLYYPSVDDTSSRTGNQRRLTNSISSGANNTRCTNGDQTNGRQRNSPPSSPPPQRPAANLRTQNISILSDMVGCIIGRGGSKITEIRRLSGTKISIAKVPHDETGERMFTIIGTPEANEKALFLLYNQLENEKEGRVNRGDAEE
jgi:heterogeneous nuclear rnp K-like protein